MITFTAYQIVLKNKNRIPLFSLNLLNSFQLLINIVINKRQYSNILPLVFFIIKN